jgi:hypothetical protein
MDVRDSPRLSRTHTYTHKVGAAFFDGWGRSARNWPETRQRCRSLFRGRLKILVFSTHVEAFLSLCKSALTAAGIAYCGTEMEAIGAL